MSSITIDLTESDLQELQEGKIFDWTYPDENGNDIKVRLYNIDWSEDGTE